jgi:plasmid rolling circle replication initiator protein Rep
VSLSLPVSSYLFTFVIPDVFWREAGVPIVTLRLPIPTKPQNRGRRGYLPESKDLYLSHISPKDKHWDENRADTERISEAYRQTKHQRYAERTQGCSPVLGFGIDDQHKLKLRSAHFCRCRHCAICQSRRTKKWMGKVSKVLPKIQEEYPTARYLFLTLTVRSCDLTELRTTLTRMNKGWERLTQRKQFPAIGWLKSVEVTKGKDGTAHPHFHALLIVKSSYFGSAGGYLSQKKWRELWQSCMRIDYDPDLDIRVIKPKSGTSDIGAALKETVKYAVKAEDLFADPAWLEQLTDQMHKTRAIATGGIFKKYLSEKDLNDPDDLIHVDEEGDGELVSEERFYFGWREKVKRYAYRKPQQEN